MRPLAPPFWLGRGGYVLLVALTGAASALTPGIGWAPAVALTVATFALIVLVAARRDAHALVVRRDVATPVVLGRPALVRVTVDNRGTNTVRLGVVEAPVARLRVALDEVVATLGAGASATLSIACLPVERGDTALVATYVWFEAGWGIVRHRRRVDDRIAVRVLPDLPAFGDVGDLALRARLLAAGARRLRRTGASSDVAQVRDYVAGDAFREIEWKATARRGHLMVAEREVERSQQVGLVVDAGRLMAARIDGRRKLDIAISAALGIASAARVAGDRVGVHAFAGTTLARVAPRSGPGTAAALLDALGAVEPRADEPDYERAALELGRTYRKRSLLVVFTDVFDPVASAALIGVLGLLVRRHVVVVALLNDGVLGAALADPAASPTRRAVAQRLADERAAAVAQLRARGMLVVDVAATALRAAVLDAYVAVKQRGRL